MPSLVLLVLLLLPLLILDGRQGGHRNPAEKEAGSSEEVALMGEGHVKRAVMLNTDTSNC